MDSSSNNLHFSSFSSILTLILLPPVASYVESLQNHNDVLKSTSSFLFQHVNDKEASVSAALQVIMTNDYLINRIAENNSPRRFGSPPPPPPVHLCVCWFVRTITQKQLHEFPQILVEGLRWLTLRELLSLRGALYDTKWHCIRMY